jgi:hypothetical protein
MSSTTAWNMVVSPVLAAVTTTLSGSRAGSSRQGVEVRAMYTMAAGQARSEMVRCRPP